MIFVSLCATKRIERIRLIIVIFLKLFNHTYSYKNTKISKKNVSTITAAQDRMQHILGSYKHYILDTEDTMMILRV